MSEDLPRVFAAQAIADLEDSDSLGSKLATLSEETSHKLRHVLRISSGSKLIVVCPATRNMFSAELVDTPTAPGQFGARIIAPLSQAGQALHPVKSLIFGIAKGPRTDLVCEKVAELGLENLILFQAERSVVRLSKPSNSSDMFNDQKVKRWERLLQSAHLQSKRTAGIKLHVAADSAELFNILATLKSPHDLCLLCSLDPAAPHMRTIPPPSGQAHIAIGPEGDFSPQEMAQFRDFGFIDVTLGQTVLRSETAAIVSVAIAGELFGR